MRKSLPAAVILCVSILCFSSACSFFFPEVEEPPVAVANVLLNTHTLALPPGATYRLKALAVPSNAENRILIWDSSVKTVATVDGTGLITAIAAGETTIMARSQDSGVASYCTLRVASSDGTLGTPVALTLGLAHSTVVPGSGYSYYSFTTGSDASWYTFTFADTSGALYGLFYLYKMDPLTSIYPQYVYASPSGVYSLVRTDLDPDTSYLFTLINDISREDINLSVTVAAYEEPEPVIASLAANTWESLELTDYLEPLWYGVSVTPGATYTLYCDDEYFYTDYADGTGDFEIDIYRSDRSTTYATSIDYYDYGAGVTLYSFTVPAGQTMVYLRIRAYQNSSDGIGTGYIKLQQE